MLGSIDALLWTFGSPKFSSILGASTFTVTFLLTPPNPHTNPGQPRIIISTSNNQLSTFQIYSIDFAFFTIIASMARKQAAVTQAPRPSRESSRIRTPSAKRAYFEDYRDAS
jgi:hypothetical protein